MVEPEQILKADGFDEAIIGACANTGRLIYSIDIMKCILVKEMSEEDAMEHLYYNIIGAYLGEGTPIYLGETLYLDI